MNPEYIALIIIQLPTILFAVTLHEVAHGYMAYRLGDPTAYNEGRLSLNPLKHLDPLGVVAFFLVHIGWAKPVPVNPAYFRNPRKDMLMVALAGPVTNLLLAFCSVILLRLLDILSFLPDLVWQPLEGIFYYSVYINVALAVFNLFPIPPLDGSKVLMGVLPEDVAYQYSKLEPFGFVILMFLLYTGVLSRYLWPISLAVRQFLLSLLS